MTEILDDKSEHCIPFIIDRIHAHRESYSQAGEDVPPFFLGLNGVQGAGKTTLVSGTVSYLMHLIVLANRDICIVNTSLSLFGVFSSNGFSYSHILFL